MGGSDKDNTYYWWVRDHWHRQYNGHLRCCCGWEEGSDTPMFAGRIGNRCDFRRQVTQDEDLSKCRDANEEDVDNLPHGLSYEGGCNDQYNNQIGSPIPEDDSMCWEVRYFGEAGDDDNDDEEENDDGDNEGPECEGMKKQQCKKMNECTWNAKEKVCVEACDGEDCNNEEDSEDNEGPECEGMKKQKCKKMDECTWDANENVCVEACDGEDCNNEEDSEDEEGCEAIKRQKDCKKNPECKWNKSKKVCKESPSNKCEKIKKKNCKKSSACRWDKNENSCVEKGQANRKLLRGA